MSEKPTEPPRPLEIPPGSTGPLPKPRMELDPSDPASLLFADNIPNTDSVPTQISKKGPDKLINPVELPKQGNLQGKKLAHFELIDPIGRGGMATVIKARDTTLDRLVALKILPPEMAADPDHVQRFYQEARSAAKLDHENIARVFFCGQDQNLYFIAFEFVEGATLKSLLESRGHMHYLEALQLMIQVARGLTHAAQRGVVHRDIKPSNIIITPEQRAKIVDMGLARAIGPAEGGLTQSGVTLGTFDYISPEQALEPRDADHRSDIYSLGCTFYHALTGKCPVPEGTAARKLYHHQHVKPADPRLLRTDIPPTLISLLDRMMAKRQEDRFQTPAEMLIAMESVAGELGMGISPQIVSSAPPFPLVKNEPNRVWVPVTAFALLALVILIDSFSGQSRQSPPGWANPQSNKSSQGSTKDGNTSAGKEGVVNPPGMVEPRDTVVVFDKDEATALDLAAWLEKHKSAQELEIILSNDLDLSPGEGRQEPGLNFTNKKVTLRGKDPARPPTVKLVYDGRPNLIAWTLLSFEGEEVVVQDLKMILDARLSETRMQGVVFKGGKTHQVRRVQLIQTQASRGENFPLASIVMENNGATRPSLVVDESCFLGFEQSRPGMGSSPGEGLKFRQPENGGQAAIRLQGNASLMVRDSVFSPHAAALHFTGTADQENKVILQHCSFLAGAGSALMFAERPITPSIEMRQSIYARASDASLATEGEGPAFLKLANPGNTVRFQGQDNRYFQIDLFLSLPFEQETSRDLTSFQKYLARNNSGKDDSKVLDQSPWKDEQPLKLLEENRLNQAFQAKDTSRDLRFPSSPTDRLLGAERFLQISYLRTPLPPLDARTEETGKARMVDPTRDDPAALVFKTLEAALTSAKNGDTILLNWDGELLLAPNRLEKAGVEITLKPATGKKPVLVSAGPKETESGALFQVIDATLRLEGLDILLRPSLTEGRTHSMGTIGKSGSLILRNCQVTMEKGSNTNLPALFALAGESNLMMMEAMPGKPPPPPSSLVLDSCKIRGECHLFRNRTNKPCDVQISGSLIALAGSLLKIEGPATSVTSAGFVSARFSQSTLCTGFESVHFSNLRKPAGPIPLRASDCLFIPMNKAPIVKMVEGEVDAGVIKEAIRFEGQRNAYVQIEMPLVLASLREDATPINFSREEWQEMFQEVQPKYVNQMPEAAQYKPGPFWMAPPGHFRLESVPNAGVMENSPIMTKPGS